MQFLRNQPLKDYSTMQLGGVADAVCTIHSKEDLLEALKWAEENKLKILVLGEGSNVVFGDGFDGLIIVNRISGFEILEEDEFGKTVLIGAGENWDRIVGKLVAMNLSGVEALSAIPGTAGATPVQNVGAYGQEIKDTFVELEAYNLETKKFEILDKEFCKFSYRRSIFKPLENRKYIIVSVTLKLKYGEMSPPFYPSLQRYLEAKGIKEFTPQIIREAVCSIRANILPDPKKIPNNGSFFKNPMVDRATAEELKEKWPQMPSFDMPDGKVKIPAGWLIDNAGLKGYHAHGLKTYENNALVIVNESAKNTEDLKLFKQEIIDKVNSIFGITIEQEPELI